MKKLKEFKTILNMAKKYKIKILLCFLGIFISSFSYILIGYLNGRAIEEITKFNLNNAILFLLIYLFSEIFGSLLERFSFAKLSKIETKMARECSYLTYQKVLSLPAYAFEEKTSGEFINRVTNDTSTIINSFDEIFGIVTRLIASVIIYIYILYNSYIIALEIIVFIVIFAFVVKFFHPQLEKVHKKRKKINDEAVSQVSESIRGVREIKTLGIKNSLFYNLRELIKKSLEASSNEIDLYFIYDVISNILKSFLEVGSFITGAILLYKGQISLTFFIAITYYIYRYTWIIENITSFTKTYNEVLVSVTRINEILENKLFPDVTFGKKQLKNCEGVINFNNVTFSYPNEGDVLKNFNVTFKPHQKIGIVGKSGQGKTTIFNLLTRVFDTKVGSITIDGINIEDLTEEDLRKNVAIIRQEPFLFNKTIKENFLLLNDKIRLKEIREYCKMAYIDDYIMSLPKKYDTVLGEGGVNLSGGQKQRLSIARALAKQSKIILFDEATSALDNKSQTYIKKVIDDLVKDHTVLIIAHRLSTIIDADIIYVVDNGEVKDIGTHKELIKKSPTYKQLYNSELK